MWGHILASLRRAACATLRSGRDFARSAVLGLMGVGAVFAWKGGKTAKEELLVWALVAVSPALAWLVGVFLWRAVRGTGEWTAQIYRLGDSIFFALKSTRGQEQQQGRVAACVVIDPLERQARAEAVPMSPDVLQFKYPGEFEGAPDPVDGEYDATWFRQNKRGTWVELHHRADIAS